MNLDTQLKLQAFVDGELPETDTAEMQRLIDSNAEARALATELRSLKSALAGNEIEVKVPEAREFYWSKISREIERIEAQAPIPPQPVHWSVWLKRLLAPVGVVAVLMVILMQQQPPAAVVTAGVANTDAALTEVSSDSMGTMMFSDHTEGITMVWIYDRSDEAFTEAAPADTLSPQ